MVCLLLIDKCAYWLKGSVEIGLTHCSDKNQVNKVTAKQDKVGGIGKISGTPVPHETHRICIASSSKTTGPKGSRNLP